MARFLADPIAAYDKRFVRSEEFKRLLLFTVKEMVNDDAASGRDAAEDALDLFLYQQRKALDPRITCHIITSECLLAAADRRLGFASDAAATLERADQKAQRSGCDSCRREVVWRKGILASSQGHHDEGERLALKAMGMNVDPAHDHDVDGNGRAQAILAYQNVLSMAEKHETAIDKAMNALEVCDPEISPAVYRAALFNIAASYLEIGTEEALNKAERYLDKAAAFFAGKGLSAERAMLTFARGELKVRRGDRSGRSLMEKAKDDFVRLEMPREACIAGADLSKLDAALGSAWEVEHTILSLATVTVPSGARTLLDQIVDMALVGRMPEIQSLCVELRRVLGADKFFPCLI